ncbi:hypothetical protein IC229_27310 [Spirosoma sp. BT702]|uniref:Uncharacterized protein n=1 Tax=Spirosoma profusum TaxID=2771354 RepID=A0A926Y0K6_9BACT|nr:hypothetical protein [Spirosoma profusum]
MTTLLTAWPVGNFQVPLSDGYDTDQYEYVGYFFGKNLSLWPFPQLNLVNTQTFYPYGTNQVFLDWGFERDYWYGFCYRLFDGPGPYLQFYYVYSLVVTSVGTFLLLRSRFGLVKSAVAGLIVSIFNFYALWKFPIHMNVCVAHWTVLCMVATYRLLLDVVQKNPISLTYWLLCGWLHIQILGQELAYVAGYALMFTALTWPVLAVVLYRRFPVVSEWPTQLLRYIRNEFRQHKTSVATLLFLIGLSLWLYFPLTLQIALTAWQFNFDNVTTIPSWSHPLRLLLPHLPGLDSYAMPYQRWLRDTFESYAQGSPGLYLTLLGIFGWWQIRRNIALWLPIVLMLVLCLLYHPVLVPSLKLFPWFSFNRHGGRASLVYPILLCLLALPVQWPRQRIGKIVATFLLVLMCLEWYTSYSLRLDVPVNVVSAGVIRYCAVIRQQPGEAVLDWPFCTVGADGTGNKEGLCPNYDQLNAVFTFRRFYDKSGVGQYFGRLHPDQIQPFLRDGWPQLLTPGRNFTDQDWHFMDRFLRNNHFAGINLYLDLLPPQQIAGFYQRFGRPIAEAKFPAAGHVVFIPLRPKKEVF